MATNTKGEPGQDLNREQKAHLRKITRAAEKVKAAEDEFRQLITDGFALEISGPVIAASARLSKPRVYQIRDGRR